MVSKRVVLADVPPEPKPERGYVRMFPRNENSNEGTFAKTTLLRNRPFIGSRFWGGDATKHFSVKKGVFSEKGGGNAVNGGFGKDFHSGRPFSEEVRAIQ